MRLIRSFIILVLLAFAVFYFLDKNDILPEEALEKVSAIFQQKENKLESKSIPQERMLSSTFKGDLFQWIGKPADELTDLLGKPVRKDLSAYAYVWWVYTDQEEQYIQFGIQDGKIVTIFATGNNLSSDPIEIGQSYEAVNEALSFTKEVDFNNDGTSYEFLLNDDDLKMRPLTKITDNIFLQSYFDTFTNELSSIRLLSGEIMLKHRPYELRYRGKLPDSPNLTDEEWAKVESGMEQQIFDITNVMRNYYEKPSLSWNESVRDVAFLHSQDMAENNYFSHYSLNGDGLKERLEANDVYYFSAGENIAAQYPDAPAAIEGWLNSKGHREALLNDDYTHIGVGVYRFYYTQNFLAKPH